MPRRIRRPARHLSVHRRARLPQIVRTTPAGSRPPPRWTHGGVRSTSPSPRRSTVYNFVTVVGNVGDSPRRSNLASGPVTNFRMASTPRRYDAASQGWVDGRTLWVDVECWGNLSGNVAASISKGDPVIVCGQLLMSEWESD